MKQNVYYTSEEFTTLGDFLNQEGLSPAFSYKQKPKQFLDFTDKTGKSNFTKIKESYNGNPDEISDANTKYSSGNLNSIKLSPPIVFTIDGLQAKTDLYAVQGNLTQNTKDVNYFISQRLANLVLNPQYVLKSKNSQYGDLKSTYPKLTVWLWSRTLSSSLSIVDGQLASNFELINISKFIDRISLSSTKEGSSFSFGLTPLKGSYKNDLEGWKINKDSFREFTYRGTEQYKAEINMEDGEMKNKDFFFHNVIQQNDMVFVSFEDVLFEKEDYQNKISVPFNAINSKIWDLIGFVDNNEISISRESESDVSLNISGRDVTKLLIEDGSYFWATEFGFEGTIRFAGNRDNRIVRRVNSGPDGLASYFSIGTKSIEYAIKFVISQLSNTGIVPNEIFQSYGNRRSTIFSRIEAGERPEIVINPNGKALNSGFTTEIKTKQQSNLREIVADGVWSIVKVIIDPQIANLRLVDLALFNEQGSFINFMNRICQEPFVEFYTETIADMFYLIARRPPFNKKSILGAINGIKVDDINELTEIQKESLNLNTAYDVRSGDLSFQTQSFVTDIEPVDVIRLNLRFDERVYTWFKLEARYALGGADGLSSLALLPAFFLPTYTNIWGSRPLNVGSNYINYVPSSGKDGENNYLNAVQQAIYDMAWLIETNAYLPFTRTGTITMNEDRRIKKGMHIRLKSTGEIYLVTSVNHEMSITGSQINRTTTLQVERGMVEEYINGKDIEGIGLVSYFNLVDTPINIKRFVNQAQSIELDGRVSKKDPVNSIITNWKENEQVIDFFLKRRQFK